MFFCLFFSIATARYLSPVGNSFSSGIFNWLI